MKTNTKTTTLVLTLAVAILGLGFHAEAGTMTSALPDRTVYDNASGHDIDRTELNTGKVNYGNQKSRAVMVFQLPDVGAVPDPFTSALLSVSERATGHYGSSGVQHTTVDLYGLDRTSSSPVVDIDDGDGMIDYDAAGTLLHDNWFNYSGTSWTAESTDVTDFVNTQYDGGSGAGDYVFMRLQFDPNGSYMSTYARYYIAAGDYSDTDASVPTITYEAVPEPASFVLVGLGSALLACRRRRRRAA
mgnify:FL=1